MPPNDITDISLIRSKVIALNYLEEEEQQRAMTYWDSRFAKDAVFWIDARDCESIEVRRKLQQAMIQQGVTNMFGESCILVYLLDATQEELPTYAQEIWNLNTSICTMLHCKVQLVLQFVYVGEIGMGTVVTQKRNIGWISQRNSDMHAVWQHRLCMIARPVLTCDGDNSWKAAMVLVDILRRSTAPTTLLPVTDDGNVNDDVGFLRYDEYAEEQIQELQSKLAETTERIEAHNIDRVKEAVENLLRDYRERVEKDFAIYAEHHPQHTKMIIDDSRRKKKLALKGKNEEYNEAADATVAAVRATAARMHRDITVIYTQAAAKTDCWLKTMIDETKVSCEERLSQSAMRTAFRMDQNQQHSKEGSNLVELKYSESGCESAIEEFLIATREYAIYQGERDLLNAIWAAFEKIDRDDILKEKALLERERTQLKTKLDHLPTAEHFAVQTTTAGYDLPKSQFFPISAGGDSRKHLIARGEKMLKAIESAGAKAMWIHEYSGGLVVLDSAPMKAVQYVTRNYSDTEIEELLPEVQ